MDWHKVVEELIKYQTWTMDKKRNAEGLDACITHCIQLHVTDILIVALRAGLVDSEKEGLTGAGESVQEVRY